MEFDARNVFQRLAAARRVDRAGRKLLAGSLESSLSEREASPTVHSAGIVWRAEDPETRRNPEQGDPSAVLEDCVRNDRHGAGAYAHPIVRAGEQKMS